MIITVKPGNTWAHPGTKKLLRGGMRFEYPVEKLTPADTRSLTFENDGESVVQKAVDVAAFEKLREEWKAFEEKSTQDRVAEFKRNQDLSLQNEALAKQNEELKARLAEIEQPEPAKKSGPAKKETAKSGS